jgi:hypothetical protein
MSSLDESSPIPSCEYQENLDILRQTYFFSGLPLESLKIFAYLCTREKFKEGEVLHPLRQGPAGANREGGDPCDPPLRSGRVHRRPDPDRRNATVVFPAGSAGNGLPRSEAGQVRQDAGPVSGAAAADLQGRGRRHQRLGRALPGGHGGSVRRVHTEAGGQPAVNIPRIEPPKAQRP